METETKDSVNVNVLRKCIRSIKRRFVESRPEEQCCVLGDLSRDLEKAFDELESHTNEYMEVKDE